MKSAKASWIFLILSLCLMPVVTQGDDAALENSTQQAQQALNQVNQSRQEYLANVRQYGNNSPQAQASRARLDRARQNWRGKLNDLQRRRLEVRAQRQHQHQEHMRRQN